MSETNYYPMFEPFPRLEYIDGILWRLAGKLIYRRSPMWYYEVPDGFITDFASIPWLARWLVGSPAGEGPGKQYAWPAVLHDDNTRHHHLSFRSGNGLFHEAMGICDVDPWRREVMYWAVGTRWGRAAYDDGFNRQRRMKR